MITDHGISCFNLTSLFASFVFVLASGAFTIDFSTPALRRNLNEHSIGSSRVECAGPVSRLLITR
jgi:hypothetical protein